MEEVKLKNSENQEGQETLLHEQDVFLDEQEAGPDEREASLKERETGLDERESSLNEWETGLKERQTGLDERETGLKERETGLDERETGLDERETGLKERETGLDERETGLDERESRMKKREGEVGKAKKELAAQKVVIEQDREDIDQKLAEIDERESFISRKNQELTDREQKVHERENALRAAELDAEKKNNERRREVEQELLVARETADQELAKQWEEKTGELEKELADRRRKAEEEIAQREKDAREAVVQLYRDAEAQRNQEYAALDQELADLRKLADAKAVIQKREEQVKKQEMKLKEREDTLEDDRKELDKVSAKNNVDKRRLERKEAELDARENQINKDVEEKSAELIKNYEAKLKERDAALNQMRSDLERLMAEQRAVQDFKQIYGDDPTLIRSQLAQLKKDNDDLLNRLTASPSQTVQAERDHFMDENKALLAEKTDLLNKVTELQGTLQNTGRIWAENQRMQEQIDDTENRLTLMKRYYENAQAEIERLSTAQARLAEREERMKVIQTGGVEPLQGQEISPNVSECDWLDNIYKLCTEFGIVFPRRILYAFHTALKISDWSMITVLSGVSGTGKSELPKLYAAFGGMNFINVPVQPSWDSQESMLGFFNSIDNRFEPEPLLRFLFKCTEDGQFNRYMSIVLLDEMNLAHVEHYFADFLSKLETRRSTGGKDVPKVEVKLGAGVEPYHLKLARTILWAGTMNQDETTKSLSDKVLDRGLVLYFPRPTHLKDRKKMVTLKQAVEKSERTLMTASAWNSWIIRNLNKDEDKDANKDEKKETNNSNDKKKVIVGTAVHKQLNEYRLLVERINTELERTGRALGHRVWQAIEYYIVNYPTVRRAIQENKDQLTPELKDAMKIAFEDQLVQKVMPKLRGIETRGSGGECLKNIEDLLAAEGYDNLKDDFDLAMNLGYGQFIWSSAKYIQADEEENKAGEPDEDGEADRNEESVEDGEADGNEEPDEDGETDGNEEPDEDGETDGNEESDEDGGADEGGLSLSGRFRDILSGRRKRNS